MSTATMAHLSASQVTTFVGCPRKWHYGKVEHAPAERVSSNLVFGCAAHDALAAVNTAALAGETIDAPAAFRACWAEGVGVASAPIHYGAKANASDLLSLGQALVTAYAPPAGIIGVEQEIHVELTPELPPLVGRIDLIRQEGDNLVLADLKTSSTKLIADTADVEMQIGIYNEAYPAARHEAIVLGKLKTPTITVQPLTIWRRERLVQHVTEVHHAMQAGVRYAVRGWHCESCQFRDRCRKEK